MHAKRVLACNLDAVLSLRFCGADLMLAVTRVSDLLT